MTAAWIDGCLALENMDEDIQALLKHTKNKMAAAKATGDWSREVQMITP